MRNVKDKTGAHPQRFPSNEPRLRVCSPAHRVVVIAYGGSRLSLKFTAAKLRSLIIGLARRYMTVLSHDAALVNFKIERKRDKLMHLYIYIYIFCVFEKKCTRAYFRPK